MKGSYEIYDLDDDETPCTSPRPRHWTYYLITFFFIFPIKAITPLSCLITILQNWRDIIPSKQQPPSVTLWECILTLWVAIEVRFCAFLYSICRLENVCFCSKSDYHNIT